MPEKCIYKINPFKSSLLDVIWLLLSASFIIIWTYIFILFFILNPSSISLHRIFIIIFYLVTIYLVLSYIFVYSILNIWRSREYLCIYSDRFKLPRSKIIDFIKKINIEIAFKDVVKHRYIWYGAGCIVFLKNNKEILISPDNCGIEGYIRICEILEKRNPLSPLPNLNLVKKWLEIKEEGWKKRKKERELFNALKKENSKFP